MKKYLDPEMKVVEMPKDADILTDSLVNINNDLYSEDDYYMGFNGPLSSNPGTLSI